MKTNQGTEKNVIRAAVNICSECYQKLAARIEQVKANLLAEPYGTAGASKRLLRLALGEAEALAWQTGYPHLLFPALAAEKIQAATEWNARQKLLRLKNSVLAMSN
jgi:hypothetical protein